jgi:hypothetical protein
MILARIAATLIAAALFSAPAVPSGPADLLPRLPEWKATETARTYSPQSLFEYIDGAAEAYIGYDFRELAVGEFARSGSKTTVTVEIYDMGGGLSAFGMYGAERYPESRFLAIGVQGYFEEGTLNFLAGRYYVKLLCFEGGDKAEEILTLFARTIAGGIKDVGSFPARLAVFPAQGRIANGEKFLRQNVLGLKFLSNAFVVSYRVDGREFDAYLIEPGSAAKAESAWKALGEYFTSGGRPSTPIPGGLKFQDPYLKSVHAVRAGEALCLVTKLESGQDALAERILAAMAGSLRGR